MDALCDSHWFHFFFSFIPISVFIPLYVYIGFILYACITKLYLYMHVYKYIIDLYAYKIYINKIILFIYLLVF